MTPKPLKERVQHEAYRIVFLQLGGVAILAFLALLIGGLQTAFSVFAGGMAYILPNLFFVWLAFRYVGAQKINQFMVAFFSGEVFKLIFSAILFLAIVKTLSVSLLSTLVGFVGAIVSFWIACMFYFSRRMTTN